MQVELVDIRSKNQIATADISFGLDTFIINSCQNISENKLNDLLIKKSTLPRTYEIDDMVLEKLELTNRKHLFGRMNEACILYALLNHFHSKDDDLEIYPLQTELVSMMDLDCRYSNIYIWRNFHDINEKKSTNSKSID